MSLLNIHSELFLLNKSLIPEVFNYATNKIYTKLYTIFSTIPQIGRNAAIQSYVDIFCLRETFRVYTTGESKELLQKILKIIPTQSFEENKSLMTKMIADFQKNMSPFLMVFQQ
jgi:hypothetical protein